MIYDDICKMFLARCYHAESCCFGMACSSSSQELCCCCFSGIYIYICCSWNWLKSRVAQDAERTWPDAVLNCVINLKCSGGGLWGAKVLYYCIIYKYIAYMTLHIWSRFAVRYHLPPWYGPKTCALQHSAWKRRICSVFLHGGWRARSANLQFRRISATSLPKTCYLQCFGFDIVG